LRFQKMAMVYHRAHGESTEDTEPNLRLLCGSSAYLCGLKSQEKSNAKKTLIEI
jgi:hypothetical protein